MPQSLRDNEILSLARREGRVRVEDLAERFGVTVQTIRRDLSLLADAGKLERVHGGAVVPSGVANIGYAGRRALAAGAKAAIGQACARAIPNEAAVFIGIGTTTEAVARALSQHRQLLVVTNNMNVASILQENPHIEVVVSGGTLRRSDGGLVGAFTMRTIEQFKFDYAVIGCSALDEEGDLLDYDLQEVGVSQTILERAATGMLVADATKFTRAAPVRVASLQDLACFYTDRPLSPGLSERCARWSTRVEVVAPVDPDAGAA